MKKSLCHQLIKKEIILTEVFSSDHFKSLSVLMFSRVHLFVLYEFFFQLAWIL